MYNVKSMKKIKLINLVLGGGALLVSTPIASTSCSNNEVKLKIELDTNEAIAGTDTDLFVSLLNESNKPLNIKRIDSAISSDIYTLSVQGLSVDNETLGVIRVYGVKEGSVTLTVNILDENNKLTSADFTINVTQDQTKDAEIESITWIDGNESEVEIPIISVTYAISDAKVIFDGEELDFELLRSIVDNGSDETLGIEEIVDPDTGLITISMTPTELGEKNLKLKFEFYNDETKTESSIYAVETTVTVSENYIIAIDNCNRNIPNNSQLGGFTFNFHAVYDTTVTFSLGYVPEGANITYSMVTNPDPAYRQYSFNNGVLTVVSVSGGEPDDVITITAKNGDIEVATFTLTIVNPILDNLGLPESKVPENSAYQTVPPGGARWTLNAVDVSENDGSLTFAKTEELPAEGIWLCNVGSNTGMYTIGNEYALDPSAGITYWLKINNVNGKGVLSIRQGVQYSDLAGYNIMVICAGFTIAFGVGIGIFVNS